MTIKIPIKAIGKGRPRFARTGHAYTPEKTREYERMLRFAYEGECYSGKIEVEIRAYYEPPKSLSKRKRNALIGCPYDKKPDIDNMAKAVLDALNGIAYTDDKNIVRLDVSKMYGDSDMLYVTITEV